jgi:hypothetical protein
MLQASFTAAAVLAQVLGSTRDIGEALSRLTHLKFVGRREAPVLHPDFVNTLCALRRLELGNCRLGQFTPRTAEVLSRVTFLGVTGGRGRERGKGRPGKAGPARDRPACSPAALACCDGGHC